MQNGKIYSILFEQKADFNMVPAVKSVENTDHALQLMYSKNDWWIH